MNLLRRLATPPFCILSAVVVLYTLAFNPYVPPQNGDDISYFHGALSIVAGNGFTEQGKWIVDWPPVHSLLVAIAMLMTGLREYYVAKIVHGIAVLISLLLAHRLMGSEKRLQPTLCCFLIAIFPTSLSVGSGGQADFLYFAFSMFFFLLVARLRRRRSLAIAILCGIVLGCVSLTRWQGVFLGVGLAFQFLEINWRAKAEGWGQRVLAGGPELLASTIGASIFLAWKVWLEVCLRNGTAGISNYDYHGIAIWHFPNPIEISKGILNLYTQLDNVVLTIAPSLSMPLIAVVLVFLAVLLWGFALRIREHGWLCTDAYLVATLLLLASYSYSASRYMIPLSPFLLDYLFRGLGDVHSRIVKAIRGSDGMRLIQQKVFFAVWIMGLLTFDAILLFYGDGDSMGPACQFLLTDNRSYLRGYHRDLYDVCKELPSQYPNAIVASDKFHKQLIRHYSGLEAHFVGYAPDAKYSVFIQVDPACLPKRVDELTKSELEFPPSLEGRLSNPRKSGYVTLWDVDAEKKPGS